MSSLRVSIGQGTTLLKRNGLNFEVADSKITVLRIIERMLFILIRCNRLIVNCVR